MDDPLAEYQVLGAMAPEDRERFYSLLEVQAEHMGSPWWDKQKHLYEAVEMTIAFIEPDSNILIPITDLEPENSLHNKPINISLDRFYIQRYPGSKSHQLCIYFTVGFLDITNDTTTQDSGARKLFYSYYFEGKDGQAAPLHGVSIFQGLIIQKELHIQIGSILIADHVGEKILRVLDSDVLKRGITLISISLSNPLIDMISELLLGVTKFILSSDKNRIIQKIPISLYGYGSSTTPKLRQGSYVVIQSGSEHLHLEDYIWSPARSRIQHRAYGSQLPYNHLILSITRSPIR